MAGWGRAYQLETLLERVKEQLVAVVSDPKFPHNRASALLIQTTKLLKYYLTVVISFCTPLLEGQTYFS